MATQIKKLPNSQVEVEVSLTDKEFEAFWKPEYEKALKKVTIKGFRAGAAPKELLDQGVDKDQVFKDAIMVAVRRTLDEVTQENEWTIIEQPRVELLDSKKDVRYKATLTLFPEITLPDYKKIAKEIIEEKKAVQVEEKEVTEALEWLRKSRAPITRVSREAKIGDVVEAQIQTMLDGKLLENAQFERDQFVLGESRFIKGFDEKVVGQKEGGETTFTLDVPKNYWDERIKGKTLSFTVKVAGVFERAIPELNDAFAASLGRSFKTVEDLKKNITEGITQEKQAKESERVRAKILERIVKKSTVELPKVMVDRTLEHLVGEMKGILPPDPKKSAVEVEAELRTQLQEKARETVASYVAVYAIANKENLNPKPEEVEKAAKENGVDPVGHYDYIYERLQNQNVFKFLESIK